jgi:hypothetical protein
MKAYELAYKLNNALGVDYEMLEQSSIMLRQQADRIAELEKETHSINYTCPNCETHVELFYKTPQIKELSDIDLTLILEVLIDSYDDTNRCYLEYKAMWEKSPTRKARIDGMKRMVDKHANAIEKIEAILKKVSEK